MKKIRWPLLKTFLVIGCALSEMQANAVTVPWTNAGGNNNLDNGANWTGSSIPASTDTASFDSTATPGPTPFTPYLSVPFTINEFLFSATNPANYGFSLNLGADLLFQGAGVNNSPTNFQNFNLISNTAAITFINSSSADVTASERVSYNIVEGTLSFSNASTASNAQITIIGNAPNASVLFEQNSSDTFNGTITGTGTGTVTLNMGSTSTSETFTGTNTYSGATILTKGTLTAGAANTFSSSSQVQISPNGALNLAGYPNIIGGLEGTGTSGAGGLVTLGSATLTLMDTSDSTYIGSIIGTGGLTKAGTSTFTLTVTPDGMIETYSGDTTVEAGTLKAGGIGAFSPYSPVFVSGGTLDLNNSLNIIPTLSGTGGTVNLGSGTLDITAVGGTTTSPTTFSGKITGTNGILILNSNPTGFFSLLGATNDYSGYTNVNSGTTFRAGVDGAFSPNSLVILSSGATLDLNGHTSAIPNLNGSGTVTLGDGTLELTAVTGTSMNPTEFSGNITGTGGNLTLTGSNTGVFLLSGTGNNYSGATTIDGGTLRAGATGAFSPDSAVTLSPGTTLDLNGYLNTIPSLEGYGTVLLGSGVLTLEPTTSTAFEGSITGTGGLTLSAASTTPTPVFTLTVTSPPMTAYSGATTITSGTLQAGAMNGFSQSSPVKLSPGATLDLNNFDNTIPSLSGTGGTVTLGTGTLTLNDITGTTMNPTTFGGSITGNGGSLTISSNTGGLFVLSGPANQTTYTGPTTLSDVTLQAGGTNVFSAASEVMLSADSTLDLNNNSNIIGSLEGSGSVTLGTGILTLEPATSTIFSGSITSSTGGGLILMAASTSPMPIFTLSGSGNSYNGPTTITSGTLQAGANGAFSSDSAVSLSSGATLDLDGNNNTIPSLMGSGTVTLGDGTLTLSDITGTTMNPTTFGGSITGNGGSLIISSSNSGLFVLSGPQDQTTYSGTTTLSDVTLQAGAANVFSANSQVILSAGATLDLNNYDNRIGSLNGAAGIVTLGSSGNATLYLTDATSTTYGGTITGYGGVTKESGSTGTFTLSGTGNTYTGPTTINGGVLEAGVANAFPYNSDVTLASIATLNLNNLDNQIQSLAGSGTVSLGSGRLVLEPMTSTAFDGYITGTGGLILSAPNPMAIFTLTVTTPTPPMTAYSGTTTINSGTLQAGGSNALSPHSPVYLVGGTLDLNGTTNAIPSLSSPIGNGGTVNLGAGTLELTALTGTTTNPTIFAGSITGNGGSLTLSSGSTGVFALTGTGNSYTGTTTVNTGTTLQAGANEAFSPGSAVTLSSSSATLNLNGYSNTILSLAGSGSVTLGAGVLTLEPTTSTTFSGSITGTTGGLTLSAATTSPVPIFTLSGTGNSYSGPTSLEAGTLQAGVMNAFSQTSPVVLSGGTLDLNSFSNTVPSLAGTGSVTLGSGLLYLKPTTATAFTGPITGTGGLTLLPGSTGTFNLTVTGMDTYSGVTTIADGTLQAGATNGFSPTSPVILSGGTLDLDGYNNTIPNISGTVGNVNLGAGTLSLSDATSTSFSGSITGTTGGLTKLSTSTGTFTLNGSGINNYSGPTTLQAGTLKAGAANAFSANSDVVLSPSATLDLNGFNNTIAALSGTGGTVNVEGAMLTFGNGESTTFAGSFLGSGALNYNGSGAFNLTGNNSAFTGTTDINAGIFSLNNVLGGDVIVNNGGTIKGNGRVGGNLTINSGGTISPGNSIGTLNVSGNYVQEAGSTYDVSINTAGQSDLINVEGTATINGGEVVIVPGSGYDINKEYLIVNANGGRTGNYAGVIDGSLIGHVRPVLVYTPTQVFVEIETTIVNVACSHNTRQVALQLDGIVNPTASQANILNTIINLHPNQFCSALNEITGQQHAADPLVAELVNRQFIRRLYDPIRCLVTNTCGSPSDSDTCDCAPEYDAWLQSGGGYFSAQGNHDVSGFKIQGFEVTGGVQKTFLGNLTFGVAGSYANDRLNFNHGGDENFNSGFGGLYALYRPENYYAFADFAYGYTRGKLNRHIQFGSIGSIARSRPEINQFTFYAEGGVDISLCDLLIQPFFGVETDAVWRKRIREHGAGDLNLDVKKRDYQNTFSRVGFHVTTAALPGDISLSLDMAWLSRLNSQKNRVQESFASFGTPFFINGLMYERNSFEGALTASKTINDACTVYLEVAGEGWKRAGGGYGLLGVELSW